MIDILKDWFGDHGKLTPASRLFIILFAVVGLVTAPIVTWFAKGAYDEFKEQTKALSEIQLYLSGAAERAKQRDEKMMAVEKQNASQQMQLDDHERRLIRIETLNGKSK